MTKVPRHGGDDAPGFHHLTERVNWPHQFMDLACQSCQQRRGRKIDCAIFELGSRQNGIVSGALRRWGAYRQAFITYGGARTATMISVGLGRYSIGAPRSQIRGLTMSVTVPPTSDEIGSRLNKLRNRPE